MEQSTQASNYDDPVVAAQAKNLTKAIFQHESGLNYNATGDAGTSHGAGQWQPATWKAQAQDVLGDANAPMTPENQSVVAQGTIRKLIKEGKNAAQIAAIWNSGSDKDWENKVGTKTINGQQIKYNVPKYVKDVTDLYQQNKNQTTSSDTSANSQMGTPIAHADTTTPEPVYPEKPKGDLLDTATNLVTSLFPGGKIGEAIGTLGGYLASPNKDTYDISAPTPLQVGGDAAQAALMIGSGMPEDSAGLSIFGKMLPKIATAGSAGGRIAQVAGVGAGMGATSALANGSTDPTEIAKQGLIGGGTGAALGTTGEVLNKIGQFLPQRLVQGVIKNSNPEVAQYALTKKLGNPAKMLEESDASLNAIGSQLGAALKHDNVSDVIVPSQQIVPKILEQFPNAELSPEVLQSEINKIAPLQKALTTKLFTGEGLTIDELHTLNSAIGKNTYKMAFDDPMVKAGKDIGNAFYQASKDIITTTAPDTAPLFDQYSKEIQLNGALDKAVKRGSKTQALTLKDIVALMSGFGALGPAGAAGAFAAERIATSPTANLKAAGILNKLRGVQKLAPMATSGLVHGVLNRQ